MRVLGAEVTMAATELDGSTALDEASTDEATELEATTALDETPAALDDDATALETADVATAVALAAPVAPLPEAPHVATAPPGGV